MKKAFRNSRFRGGNTPMEKASSKQHDGEANGKPKVVRSWDLIPSHLKHQPFKEHRINRHKNGNKIAFVVDSEVGYVLDEKRLTKPNRRRKKKEIKNVR